MHSFNKIVTACGILIISAIAASYWVQPNGHGNVDVDELTGPLGKTVLELTAMAQANQIAFTYVGTKSFSTPCVHKSNGTKKRFAGTKTINGSLIANPVYGVTVGKLKKFTFNGIAAGAVVTGSSKCPGGWQFDTTLTTQVTANNEDLFANGVLVAHQTNTTP